MTQNDCPTCRNENVFCSEHQKHEQEVYESPRYAGKHDTVEFRVAMSDARQKDLLEA